MPEGRLLSMERKQILVLFGGCSTEYDVSLQSAAGVLSHFPDWCEAVTVGITREGKWLYYTGPLSAIHEDTWQREEGCVPCALSPDRGGGELVLLDGERRRIRLDAVFPVLHGKNGEDGTVQGMAELAGIPVIGCGTLASALCMDKDRAHKLASLAGVRVPKGAVFPKGSAREEVLKEAEVLGWPVFVKPVRAGSSFGIARAARAEELWPAVEEAFRHDDEVILEEAIPGFEVGCAVMGSRDLITGQVDEIELSGGFFDYEEKYTLKTSAIHCPARISRERAAEVRETAKKVYRALGCRVFARVDLFLTPEGEIVFNEVNTIPGFTSHSRYPNMMKADGLEFSALVDRLVRLGLEG